MLLESFDSASLEDFWATLVTRGFEPLEGTSRIRWRGPIHPAFNDLTDAQTMDIMFSLGWPLQPPAVLVDGLDTNHYTLDGLVCLWRDGDSTQGWKTVDGLFERIEDWCGSARNNWPDDDLPFDAYLNFKLKLPTMATFDFKSLGTGPGSWGEFRGVPSTTRDLIDLQPGAASSNREPRGLWFRVDKLTAPPPRQLSELSKHLNKSQRKGLERALADRKIPEPFRISGGADMILFAWERRGRTDLLIMACKGTGDQVEAGVLMAEPNDEHTLMLRAGPDAGVLRDRRVVVFGAGALGGHAAVTLAESGIGSIKMVDYDFLTPGNVVRHVAGHDWVGASKVEAVKAAIVNHAPWTVVESVALERLLGGREEIAELLNDVDIVVDATGNDAFVPAVAQVAAELSKPLVSGALFRGGFIGRVQRQALETDRPIAARLPSDEYPVIPAGDPGVDLAEPNLGCSSPVNNAPPSSVLACASSISQAAIDVLTSRYEFDDEMIDVYRPLAEPPFNRTGRFVRLDAAA